MPAISFQEEWINKLLSGTKQQTTRPQSDRIKLGYVCTIYNQQRRRIMDKPIRRATPIGQDMIISKIMDKKYPIIPNRIYIHPEYYAHFLGKVEIAEVYDIHPCEMTGEGLEAWARDDGFHDSAQLGFTRMELADTWFRAHYGDGWMHRWWTVIRWHGWLELYFEPEAI